MRQMSASMIKRSARGLYVEPLQNQPRDGTKLREVYDLFVRNPGTIFSFVDSKTLQSNLGYLRDMYLLDIRSAGHGNWCLVGRYTDKGYEDYFAKAWGKDYSLVSAVFRSQFSFSSSKKGAVRGPAQLSKLSTLFELDKIEPGDHKTLTMDQIRDAGWNDLGAFRSVVSVFGTKNLTTFSVRINPLDRRSIFVIRRSDTDVAERAIVNASRRYAVDVDEDVHSELIKQEEE